MLGMRRVMVAAALPIQLRAHGTVRSERKWGPRSLDHHRGGSGEPLVLIHGIGHTWRGWKPMLPALEQSFDVLAVDVPGFGHSGAAAGGAPGCTAEALADAVERQMLGAGFDTGAHRRQLARRLDRAGARGPRAAPRRHRHLAGRTRRTRARGVEQKNKARAALAGRKRSSYPGAPA